VTVVVTGASGHVGCNLIRELLRRGRPVRAVVHEHLAGLEDLDVERVRADVCDPDSLRRAFEGAEVLFHLAAIISIDGSRGGRVPAVNVDGVANACQAALDAGIRRVVHFSSIHAFRQEPLDEPLDETRGQVADDPSYPVYDRSKAQGEQRVRAAIERGLDAVIVNPTAVIGPHDFEPSRIGRTFLDVVNRKLPAVIPGGFDFVDVRDVVSSALAAEERGRTGENYLLGGYPQSVAELVALFQRVTGAPPPRFNAPLWAVRIGVPFVMAWGRLTGREPLYTRDALHALGGNRQVSHERASRELGHNPRPTLESAEAIYKSFLDQGVLPDRGRS
jgi:dihydroflavonol-4-reductase